MELSRDEFAELQGIFRAECDEHLAALNGLLMTLEERRDDASALNETFRRVHSIKGAARMVGFKGVEALAHAMESTLALVRDGKLEMTQAHVSALFEGADAVTQFVTAMRGRSADDPLVAEVLKKLDSLAGAVSDAGTTSEVLPKDLAAGAPVMPQASEALAGSDTVRVNSEKIDRLIAIGRELSHMLPADESALTNLAHDLDSAIGRLATNRSGEPSGKTHEDISLSTISRGQEHLRELTAEIADRLRHRTSLLGELRDGLADLRMLPAQTILAGMARVARDVAITQGKHAEVTVSGGDVAIDKAVLDALKEPLMHLVRNAVAHGIEPSKLRIERGKPPTGAITIAVSTGTTSATLSVEDDGDGLNYERIREAVVGGGYATAEETARMPETDLVHYIFKAGFSTAREADSISGRGVGLDVVSERTQQLRGSYQVDSVPGRGTRFSLRVPVSLLVWPLLVVRAGSFEACIRQTDVHEAVLLRAEHVFNVDGRISATIRDEVVPVLPLESLAGGDGRVVFEHETAAVPAVVIEHGGRKAAFIVAELLGVSELIVRALPKPLGKLPGIAGYAIAGSGLPLCVLDGEYLVHSARERAAEGAVVRTKPAVRRSLLIVDDSLTTRTLLRNIMASAGYDVETAVDGRDAWAKVHERKFDCIVSDIEMPTMKGWELLERLKRDAQLSEIPFVLITSLSKDEERRRGLELGADAYIVKSLFNETHLLETVERLVA